MITSNRELLFTYLTSLGKEWSLYTSKFSYIQKTIQFSQFYIAACLNQILSACPLFMMTSWYHEPLIVSLHLPYHTFAHSFLVSLAILGHSCRWAADLGKTSHS